MQHTNHSRVYVCYAKMKLLQHNGVQTTVLATMSAGWLSGITDKPTSLLYHRQLTLKFSCSVPPTCSAAILLKLSVADCSLASEPLSSVVHPCWCLGASGPLAQGEPPRVCNHTQG